jgi:hypothetical protein
MAEAHLAVSVERIIHDTLTEMAERVKRDHGLMLLEARFDWRTLPYTSLAEPPEVVPYLTLTMQTVPKGRSRLT